jgi:RNA polymerase sigma-70 factor, ECF subfamily
MNAVLSERREHDASIDAALAPLLQILQSQASKPERDRAFAALYDASASLLMPLAMRMVRNQSDAEDVLCEVYRQVWERPLQYNAERGPVMAWLYVITKTRALDFIRKQSNYAQTSSSDSPLYALTDDSELTHDAELASDQEAVLVRRGLEGLSDAQRTMLELAFFHDLSHQEIAERTGAPLGTVKSHIRRGQAALKQTLTQHGVERGHE